MPGTPFLYYGDELMMKTSPISSKDGGYQRTGVRIPMIWDNKSVNHGFSKTKGETYLPFYKKNKISVEDAIKDPNSLYNFIKKMIDIRKQNESLRDNDFEIKENNSVITISRGPSIELVINTSDENIKLDGRVVISSEKLKDGLLPSYASALIER